MKIAEGFNILGRKMVGVIGIDEKTAAQISGTPEGAKVKRSALALWIGTVAFLVSFWGALRAMGMPWFTAVFVVSFVSSVVFSIDKLFFEAWVQNQLQSQPRFLRAMRRIVLPLLLVLMAILALPTWLGSDLDSAVTNHRIEVVDNLKKDSAVHKILLSQLQAAEKAGEEFSKNRTKLLDLSKEIAVEESNMKDQLEGNRLRSGAVAVDGPGREFRHHKNMVAEKKLQLADLEKHNAELKIEIDKLADKKAEMQKLDSAFEKQAEAQVGNGVAVKLKLLWQQVKDGDVLLGLTAFVCFLTALAADAIVFIALSQQPPMNVAHLLTERTQILGVKLQAQAQNERKAVAATLPVVKVRF